MPQSRQFLFIGLFIFALLSTACQSQPGEVTGDEQQPSGGETIVSQVVSATITPLPTATPTIASASSPAPTNLSATTPSPTSTPLPTPTAIPVDAPMPTATNTSVPASVSVSSPNEVDLVTLGESLAVLDRVERRAGPTSMPTRAITYEGVATCIEKTEVCCTCEVNEAKLWTTVFIDRDGKVSGILKGNCFIDVEFAGTRDAITGEKVVVDDKCEWRTTSTVLARLINNDQIFEGTANRTSSEGGCRLLECLEAGLSSEQAGPDNCDRTYIFSLDRK